MDGLIDPPFSGLAPVATDYASLPVLDGFNWDECAAGLDGGEWYLVVFRSIRRPMADAFLLEAHDYGAYAEAQRLSGLLHYFRGTPTADGRCLSFCLWESRGQALAATRTWLHREAARVAHTMYSEYALERYILRKRDRWAALELEEIRESRPRGH
ncbi:MAG: hypothetical protein JOZ41_12875 [Chloroflexi bacterium]|nr:hypothetical protein [Chloroflexota bacterium]